jgi:hypothetical protein
MTDQRDAAKEAFRARMTEKAPALLAELDRMKALYGDDLRLAGVVLPDVVIGKPYPPEECERIQRELREGK